MTPRRLAKLLGWLGSAVLATVLIVSVWLVRHRSSARFAKEAASVIPGSMLSARNFHWTQMKAGQKQWELTARQAAFSDDKKSLRLRGVEFSMVSSDGKHITLSAPHADLVLKGNHVDSAELRGGLTVHYGDVVVTAAQAAFAPENDELSVPGPVTIEGEGLKVTGIGLTAHPRAQLFDLRSAVSTKVVPKHGAARNVL
jgi:LPS export ABC transporter protein LptC